MAATKYHIDSFVNFKGQRYQMLGLKTHIRKNNSPIYLIRWQSHCAECDQMFEFTTTIGGNFSRRCQIHKKPGIRV